MRIRNIARSARAINLWCAQIIAECAPFDPHRCLRTTGRRVSRLDCGRTHCGCKCCVWRRTAMGSSTDLTTPKFDFRSSPKSGLKSDIGPCPVRANRRHHSITSSARAMREAGRSRPRAFAVFRLITRSYLVGAWTGRSAGFSPLRTRST